MTQTTTAQASIPAEAQTLDLPVEPRALATDEIPRLASTIGTQPTTILETGDDRYYAQHWGINE